jgi:hypothetical protein
MDFLIALLEPTRRPWLDGAAGWRSREEAFLLVFSPCYILSLWLGLCGMAGCFGLWGGRSWRRTILCVLLVWPLGFFPLASALGANQLMPRVLYLTIGCCVAVLATAHCVFRPRESGTCVLLPLVAAGHLFAFSLVVYLHHQFHGEFI